MNWTVRISQEALDAGPYWKGRRGCTTVSGARHFPVRDIRKARLWRAAHRRRGRQVRNSGGAHIQQRRSLYPSSRQEPPVRRTSSSSWKGMDAIRLHVSSYGDSGILEPPHGGAGPSGQRLTDNCYICYDSDQASQEAALRGCIPSEGGITSRHNAPEGRTPMTFHAPDGNVLYSRPQDTRPLILHHLYIRKPDLDDSKAAEGHRGHPHRPRHAGPVESLYLPMGGNLASSPTSSVRFSRRDGPPGKTKRREREERGSSEPPTAEGRGPVEVTVCAML